MQVNNIYLTKMAILFENEFNFKTNELFLRIFVIFINRNVIIY